MVIGGMSVSVGSGPVVSAGVTPAFSARVTGTIEWVKVGLLGRSGVILSGGAALMICACGGMGGGREQLGGVIPRQLL